MPRDDYATAVLDIQPLARREPVRESSEEPFQILVLSRLSGVAARDSSAPVEIDRDNFDDVLARFAPELSIHVAGSPIRLRFEALDDFHPDALYRRITLFRDIEASIAEAKSVPPTPPANGNVLDRILADLPGSSASRTGSGAAEEPTDLRAFIDRVLASHLVPGESQEEVQARERTHQVASELMRAILHASEFQQLESTWRAVYFLARRLETGPRLKIFLAESGAGDRIPTAPGDSRWSVIVVNRAFGRSEASLASLRELGGAAMAHNAALLAEAEPPGGDDEGNARWMETRRRPEAVHIGVALPRLIARLPYGETGESTDEFRFEEFASKIRHSDYLWISPAFGLAYLLASAFERDGWHMYPGSIRDIERLPLHIYREDGEAVAKPCAELLLRESDVEQLLEEGIMPLASIRDTDRVKLVRVQSIAEPSSGLAGPWGR